MRAWRYPVNRPWRLNGLRSLWHRFKGRCAYCERETTMPPSLSKFTPEPGVLYASRDHRIAISLGGDDSPGNIVLACQPCNRLKAAMSWIAWQEFMRENPGWWNTAPDLAQDGKKGGKLDAEQVTA